jgi:hypothetical protein
MCLMMKHDTITSCCNHEVHVMERGAKGLLEKSTVHGCFFFKGQKKEPYDASNLVSERPQRVILSLLKLTCFFNFIQMITRFLITKALIYHVNHF